MVTVTGGREVPCGMWPAEPGLLQAWEGGTVAVGPLEEVGAHRGASGACLQLGRPAERRVLPALTGRWQQTAVSNPRLPGDSGWSVISKLKQKVLVFIWGKRIFKIQGFFPVT